MNPLQEHAHLFANGKFRVHMECSRREQPVRFRQRDLPTISGHPQYCTLIARPISDMSDEEKDSVEEIEAESEMKEGFYFALYLLSIGVYPFDQSHFDDGTVIDSTTL